MKAISGSTSNETKLIKAIQKSVGVSQDGVIGESTLSSIASVIGVDCWPITISLYGNPVIIAKDIELISARTILSKHKNSISGSFNDGSAPCSIMYYDNKYIRTVSCHFFDGVGYPETVLYREKNGIFGVKRVKHINEINRELSWAIGGLGLLGNYAPNTEGFIGKFSDVLRKTNHTVLGVKDNLVYMCYMKNMTAMQVNNQCKIMGMKYAIMLDGGHVAAINGTESFARINTTQLQLCIIKSC